MIWNARTGKELLSIEDHSGAVYSVRFSPRGNRLASASGDKTVRVRPIRKAP